jgi:lipopolysaccharide/colanic/teichoic acid biosynthesis glycosyltransferase
MLYRRCLKPALDRSLAALGLLLLSPLICAVALIIQLRIGRPVLFRQTRIGLRESPFQFYKFRTMTDARDDKGRLLSDARRLTDLGRFLRSTSLDELPQLWNVVRGDMSLIGPRPLLPEYLPLYSRFQKRRHDVKPGITGMAQVMGRNALGWDEKFQFDVWYVDNRTFMTDVRIMGLTIASVVRRKGISQQGHATAPAFTGNSDSPDSSHCEESETTTLPISSQLANSKSGSPPSTAQ